ncbi:hypothetical protein Tco_0463185 [Tanacetum coccineum]
MTLTASTPTDKSLKEFDELMSTSIDFSSYILNGLKIENLTQEILLGPAFRLLKGTRSNYDELEYDFKECYKALFEKLDWENPEGGDYLFDISKPLPLITRGKHQRVPFEFFINNDLRFNTIAGNLVKKILLKLNLSDHKSILTDSKVTPTKHGPKIEDKDHFELKGQFLKELQENTFSGSNHEDVNEHIEKVLEIEPYYCDEKKGSYGLQFSEAYFEASHIGTSVYDYAPLDNLNVGLGELVHTKLTVELADTKDIKVSLILERPFLSTTRAKINIFKRKITLRIGEERIIFKSVKPASSLTKRVYMLSLRERMEIDLEARLMGETLVLNRSLDPLNEDFIELNDLNEPFELRRNQGDDLMPTIEEGEVIKEFRTRDDELDIRIDDYPSYCNYDKKIHIVVLTT